MKKKNTNLLKKGAGRNLAARLKALGMQPPPKDIVDKIMKERPKPSYP